MPEGSLPSLEAMHPDCEKSCEKSSSDRTGSPVTNNVTTFMAPRPIVLLPICSLSILIQRGVLAGSDGGRMRLPSLRFGNLFVRSDEGLMPSRTCVLPRGCGKKGEGGKKKRTLASNSRGLEKALLQKAQQLTFPRHSHT